MVTLEGLAEMEKSSPVPLNETVCGLPVALSVIVSTPFTAPLDCGVKVTEIVQFAFPGRVAGQLLV